MPTAQSPDSRIEILTAEPIATIAPEIYGHFAEHLGGVIYDGIWVGENSKISNVGVFARALVDALVKIKPSVIRWPAVVLQIATTGTTVSVRATNVRAEQTLVRHS
jgi:hypothetical protein